MNIPHNELLSFLKYNKTTGMFHWRKNSRHKWRGMRAGSVDFNGYVVIRFNRKLYKGHRLAWFYVTGAMPSEDVEHKNLKKHDNRWRNLRLADDFLNQANTPRRKDNTSGFKSVTRRGTDGKWRVRIQSRGKRIHLGDFDDPKEAHAAYKKHAKVIFGEFARF
jgi:hypothetical protein